MEESLAYDVFIGIFHNFPRDKTDFRYDSEKIADFILENRGNYRLLENLTREDVVKALQILDAAHIVRGIPPELTPRVRTFNHETMDYSFKRFNRLRFRLSDLGQLRDLSAKFAGQFC